MEYKKSYLKLNLAFFAEGGEKTEKPTSRKKTKARKEGQVAKSQEIGTAVLLVSVFFALKSFAPGMLNRMMQLFTYSIGMVSNIDNIFNMTFIPRLVTFILTQCLLIAMPVMAVSFTVGFIVNLIQVGWHPTTKPLRPKFSKLNPLSGFKRLFSLKALFELPKALLKAAVIVSVIYSMIEKEIEKIPILASLTIGESIIYLASLAADMGINVGLLYIFVAIADYTYARYSHTKGLKMSKQEVKDEHKMIEGNPEIKGKIRQKMREASMRRMMKEVPGADVIITNPTHYAVAIKYDRSVSDAPRVIAKGVDFVAKRIKDEAREHGIEIVENKQLARTIYATVDIGNEIPEELYQAVAEILAFVYRLKEKAQ